VNSERCQIKWYPSSSVYTLRSSRYFCVLSVVTHLKISTALAPNFTSLCAFSIQKLQFIPAAWEISVYTVLNALSHTRVSHTKCSFVSPHCTLCQQKTQIVSWILVLSFMSDIWCTMHTVFLILSLYMCILQPSYW
jgi:hypothetical protein